MKIIAISHPGKGYRLLPSQAPQPQAGPDEVLIQVAAAGLNRADLLQARGLYPPPPGASAVLGMEVSGTVAALGRNVRDFAVGDRVCALLAAGGYAEFVRADSGSVLPVPASIDLIEAAGLPEAAFTAWTNVMDTGRLGPGETLLIHGGTSGIGAIAIQMFAARGHRIFTTVGSDGKCQTARGLGAARAINYRREDFVAVVKEETGGKGVDVILDMVGGDYIQRNYEAAAVDGRIVQIAFLGSPKATVNFQRLMLKRLHHTGSTLRARSTADKAAIVRAVEDNVLPLLASGKVKPLIYKTFPLADAKDAHALMESSAHIGKIVLTV
jgi:NADPH2:quinone reductase